jgi:hypothetical protein
MPRMACTSGCEFVRTTVPDTRWVILRTTEYFWALLGTLWNELGSG